MPDFNTTSSDLRQLSQTLSHQRKVRSAGLHATRRLELEKQESIRRKNAARTQVLNEDLKRRKKETTVHRREDSRIRQELERARAAYEPFSDPREFMNRWRDEIPVLLFPLRLETRFRTVEGPEGNSFQLWVRAYPDTCLIDTFEELPGEVEYRRTRAFWVATFRAGQYDATSTEEVIGSVREKRLEAWRQLLDVGSPGRAYWLSQNIRPSEGQQPTVRISPDDVLLIIPTEGGGPTPDEREVLREYYEALWRSGGNAEAVNAALAGLVNKVGEASAKALLTEYVPAGLSDTESRTATDDQRVEVSFLDFPTPDSVDRSVGAWSDPAKVSLLPDRLLVQGYQNGKLVVNEIGPLISQPLTIGPDPGEDLDSVLREAYPELYVDGEEPDADRKASAYIDYLKSRSDTRWLFDFKEAQRVGMGFVLELDEATYRRGFDRLFVVGLRLSSDANQGQEELENLLHNHQYGVTDLSFLPQGTPTNAIAPARAATDSYDRFFGESTAPSNTTTGRVDGQWFADFLGIDTYTSGLRTAAHFGHTDQVESLATQRLLYPATLGYYLESMLDTVTDEWQRTVTKEFFRSHVAPRGRTPLIRIGNQPYGILPVTGKQKGNWLSPRQTDSTANSFRVPGISDHAPVLRELLTLLETIRADWEPKLAEVAHLWRPGDPHQALLDVLGLHAGSVEWDQRMGETTKQFVNRLRMQGGFGALLLALAGGAYLVRTKELFLRHGIDLDTLTNPDADLSVELPRIMKLLFIGRHFPLGGPLIDDRPLTEVDPIRGYTADGKNYLEWLLDTMNNQPSRLKSQAGFTEGDQPRALLYQLLRHATDLQSIDTGLGLYRAANLLTDQESRQLRSDADFIGVTARPANSVESRYTLLYRTEPQIAATNVTVIDHLSTLLTDIDGNRSEWHAHRDALQKLTKVPTARLERLLAEHLDCCNYRLDAWLQGFTDLQLRAMRYGSVLEEEENTINDDDDTDVRRGIHLGAFGWVENLKPDNSQFTPAELTPEQQEIFSSGQNSLVPMLDNQNGGYIHAPSLDHATTAAVLRNAYLGNATPEDPERYAINLSSERVRMGLQLLEGMRAGQELGALLGYQLERSLHDSSLELDEYIYALRDKFSLVANRLADTEVEEGDFDTVEQLAASNVIDGLALVEKVNAGENYPWGVIGLPANGPRADAITVAVGRIVNLEDAVADLALAESVHQTVKGNFDRAAGNLNAYSKGQLPPVPEVALTPRKGHQLTHRFSLHLDPDAVATGSSLTEAEPAISAWLNDLLPPTNQIAIAAQIIAPSGTTDVTVTLADLGWSATDLLYQIDRASDEQFGNLDEVIQHFIQRTNNLGPAAEVKLLYTSPTAPLVSCFELLPLLEDARQILLAVRNLKPTDLRLPSEAREEQDAALTGDPTVYQSVRTTLQGLITDVETNVIAPLTAAGITSEGVSEMNTDLTFTAVVDNIDTWSFDYAGLANALHTYRPLNAHTDFVYAGRHGLSNYAHKLIADFREELLELLTEADTLLLEVTDAATPEDVTTLLKRVEPLVSTTFFTDTDPLAFSVNVQLRRDIFAAYLEEMKVFIDQDFPDLKTQLAAFFALTEASKLEPLTSRRVDQSEFRNRLLVLAQDLLRAGSELVAKTSILVDQANALLGPAYPDVLAALRQLLGEDFQLLPRFSIPTLAFNELQAGYAKREELLAYQRNDIDEPFPVDTWLHGMARVRPFPGNWERLQLYSEDYAGNAELSCVPLQFPLRENDSWLGLEFPADYPLEEEKLLYTAHYARAGGPVSNRFCGVLLDEWTEVIPVKEEDTGLVFHFDQPATEPAQSWLLALPTEFRGSWQWNDLMGCLHEALDLAKLRAIEPQGFEDTAYSHLLPTTISTVTRRAVTPQLNFAAVNGVSLQAISDVSN